MLVIHTVGLSEFGTKIVKQHIPIVFLHSGVACRIYNRFGVDLFHRIVFVRLQPLVMVPRYLSLLRISTLNMSHP